LHIQLWDKDILKYNDCVGEQTIDCDRFYKKAYHKNTTVNFFERHKGAAKDRRTREKNTKKIEKIPDGKEDVPDPEESKEAPGLGGSLGGGGPVRPGMKPTRVPITVDGKFSDLGAVHAGNVDSDDDEAIDVSSNSRISGRNPMYKSVSKKELAKEKSSSEGEKKSWFSFRIFSSKPKAEDQEPLLEDPLEVEKKKREAESEEAETHEMVKSMKAMTGLFDEDPEESSWLKLDAVDHNTGTREPRGQICYGVQLWPKEKAIVMPVGSGTQSFQYIQVFPCKLNYLILFQRETNRTRIRTCPHQLGV